MLKRFLLVALATIGVAVAASGLQPPQAALAGDSKNDVCEGITGAKVVNGKCVPPTGSVSLERIIKVILDVLSRLVAIVAIIMIIFSGFRYVTAAGDSGKIGAAKSTLIYAIVGLVVAALAQIIVQFVIHSATG